MCGIAGIIQFDGMPVSREILTRMADGFVHRGPDDSGVWSDGNAGLSHRRLAVIDLHGGRQPMCDAAANTYVCFNGEIYNHTELRRHLERRGVAFRTQCDTEVLVHLYNEYGVDMLSRLNGMFAFALIDRQRRSLLLARDRLGQKPLFYYATPGRLVFASELQALRFGPSFPNRICEQALHDYLTLQYTPSPATIFAGVEKLPPAAVLTAALDAADSVAVTHYWRPAWVPKTREPFAECARHLRTLVEKSVQRRMMADVPLGAFLSGGVDSSIIVGIMARQSDIPVKTFTIAFSHPRYDERRFAAAAADAFATEHHENQIDPPDLQVLSKLVRHAGEPYADASIVPTYLLSRFTRQHVTVALSGDGADELFGGYWRYRLMRLLQVADVVPGQLRRKLARATASCLTDGGSGERTFAARMQRICRAFAAPAHERYLTMISRISDADQRDLYGPRMRAAPLNPTARWLDEHISPDSLRTGELEAALDLHTYLPCDILPKVDIASMAASLEVRSPFLDPHVVEFAASLPWHYKQHYARRKRILLSAFRELLPPLQKRRGKAGFGVPIADWFRTAWKDPLRNVLLDSRAAERGFFDPTAVERLIGEHLRSEHDHSGVLWSLFVFELWCDQFANG